MNNDIFKNKQIKIIGYITIILWLAVGTKYIVQQLFKEEVQITEAFMKANLEEVESHLEIIVEHSQHIIKESDKLNIIYYIAKLIGLEISEEISYYEEKDLSEYYVKKTGDLASALIKVSTIADNENVKNFVIIRLNIIDNVNLIDSFKNVIIEGLNDIGIKEHQISLEYEGVYQGSLEQEKVDDIVEGIINNLHGIKILEHKELDMHIVYGYTGLIDEYIKASNQRINIQLAFRYNQDNDTTRVYFASPFLNHSY